MRTLYCFRYLILSATYDSCNKVPVPKDIPSLRPSPMPLPNALLPLNPSTTLSISFSVNFALPLIICSAPPPMLIFRPRFLVVGAV